MRWVMEVKQAMMDGGGLNSDTAPPLGHAVQRKERERGWRRGEGSPPFYTKQGETKEGGGELLTTPIWRRFRAPRLSLPSASHCPDQSASRGCVAVYVLWLVVSNVMVAVAMAHLKNHNLRV